MSELFFFVTQLNIFNEHICKLFADNMFYLFSNSCRLHGNWSTMNALMVYGTRSTWLKLGKIVVLTNNMRQGILTLSILKEQLFTLF